MKKYSKSGYKRKSEDKENPYNLIKSNQITMKNVDFPVLGIDNLGNTKIMKPGAHYIFPGNEVFEVPLKTGDRKVAQEGTEVVERDGVRYNNPGVDDSHSTHVMAHEFVEGVGWVAFPTLFQVPTEEGGMEWVDLTKEKWIQEGNMPEEWNWGPAYKLAKQLQEVYEFGYGDEALKQAEDFAVDGYKNKQKGGSLPKAQDGKEKSDYQIRMDTLTEHHQMSEHYRYLENMYGKEWWENKEGVDKYWGNLEKDPYWKIWSDMKNADDYSKSGPGLWTDYNGFYDFRDQAIEWNKNQKIKEESKKEIETVEKENLTYPIKEPVRNVGDPYRDYWNYGNITEDSVTSKQSGITFPKWITINGQRVPYDPNIHGAMEDDSSYKKNQLVVRVSIKYLENYNMAVHYLKHRKEVIYHI